MRSKKSQEILDKTPKEIEETVRSYGNEMVKNETMKTEKKTLISCEDYVIDVLGYKRKLGRVVDTFRVAQLVLIKDYAQLLKTEISLGQFIPCDLEGNVLEDIKTVYDGTDDMIIEYQQAQKRVIFKGWKCLGKIKHSETIRIRCESDIILFYEDGDVIIDPIFSKSKKIKNLSDLVDYNLEMK